MGYPENIYEVREEYPEEQVKSMYKCELGKKKKAIKRMKILTAKNASH